MRTSASDYVIMCIGNPDGGDDAIGPYIAERLDDTAKRTVLNCGTVPENYTSIVKRLHPKQLIIIDAAEMGLSPGEIRIVPKDKIGVMHISTHGIPLSVLISYLESSVPQITFIAIQPHYMDGGLSVPVQQSGDKLITLLTQWKIDQIKQLE